MLQCMLAGTLEFGFQAKFLQCILTNLLKQTACLDGGDCYITAEICEDPVDSHFFILYK